MQINIYEFRVFQLYACRGGIVVVRDLTFPSGFSRGKVTGPHPDTIATTDGQQARNVFSFDEVYRATR